MNSLYRKMYAATHKHITTLSIFCVHFKVDLWLLMREINISKNEK